MLETVNLGNFTTMQLTICKIVYIIPIVSQVSESSVINTMEFTLAWWVTVWHAINGIAFKDTLIIDFEHCFLEPQLFPATK